MALSHFGRVDGFDRDARFRAVAFFVEDAPWQVAPALAH